MTYHRQLQSARRTDSEKKAKPIRRMPEPDDKKNFKKMVPNEAIFHLT